MRCLTHMALCRWATMLLAFGATLQPSKLMAQGSVTGSVRGTITDASEAIVPGVNVTLRNTQTNQTRITAGSNLGTYEFANVPIGRYQITAENTGFAKIESSEFEVTVQNASVINLALRVGSTQETVNVAAEAEVLNTADATLGGLVDNKKITELPLNGRSFVDLLVLQPGATPIISTGGGRVSATRNDGGYINGTDDFYNDFTIDGGDYNDVSVPGSGINKALIGTGVPPDAIAEFRVITAAADAEFGTVAGAHINVATKSGTNQFHGTGWEFVRNSAMDARNTFDQTKLPFSLNQFGGVIGGPVIRDKNFFFASYEGYRQTLQTTLVPVVPTPRLLDAVPGGAANGNLQQLLKAFYPGPDAGYSATALVAPVHVISNQSNDRDSFIIRDDAHLSDKDTLSGRIVSNHATGSPGVILSTGLTGGNNGFGWQAVNPQLTYTRLISNSMVNEARFTYNRTALNVSFDAPPQAVTALGYSPDALAANSVPTITFTGTGLTNVGWGATPQARHVNVYEWTDTLSKNVGRWVIKAGFSAFRYQPNVIGSDTPKPAITFSGFGAPFDTAANGITTARFLQQTQTFNLNPFNSSARYPRYSLFAGFEQNTLQLTRTLTLTFGVRYEINTIPTEKFGVQRNLYGLTGSGQPSADIPITLVPAPSLANVSLLQPSAAGLPYAQTHKAEVEPRFGFAWKPTKRMVVRGGYGLYYQRPDLYAFATGTSNPPVSIPTALTNQLFGASANPANFLNTNKSISVYDPTNKAISVQSYNFNIQYQTDANGFIQVGYSGSHTVHYNIVTTPNYGAAYTGVRPNTGYLSITEVENLGNSNYNSLQAQYSHRYSHGVTSQVSYTYAKNIGLAEAGTTPTNLFNFALDRGSMDADLRQSLVVSLVYDLPWGRGKRMFNTGVLSGILGNWAVSGVSILHTGMPFSILAGSDINRDGNTTDRATILAGKKLSDVYSNSLNKTQFLLPQAQVNNVILATSGGGLLGRNVFTGPAFFNIDFGAQKNIPITEHSHLEFRSEFFNLFNHANFNNPNSTLTSPLFGQILSTVSNARQVQLALKFYF